MNLVKVNIEASNEAKEIFDFINRAGQETKKCDSSRCSYALFEKNLEESGEDIKIQYNYLVRLLNEIEELEEETFKELNEQLVEYEVAVVLENKAEQEKIQYKIDVLSEKLDEIEERLEAISVVYNDLTDEIMF